MKEKRDILLVGGSYPCPAAGGSINYINNLISELDSDSIYILTANCEKDNNIKWDRESKFSIRRTNNIIHPLTQEHITRIACVFKLICLFFDVCRAIIHVRPRIVCITEFSYFSLPIFLASLFFCRKLSIFTYAEEISQLKRRFIASMLFRLIFNYCTIIFTVSDFTSQLVCCFGNYENKIYKVVPSISVKGISSKNVSSSNYLKILTVGRLEKRKGHVQAIHAVACLHQKYPNVIYNIAGCGSFEHEIQTAIEKENAGGYIKLLGKVSDEDLESLYRESDIFTMPHMLLEDGDTEGCPTVFLEASYYCLPVIGGNAGGVKDAIIDGKTGFIVDAKSAKLEEKLEILISNQKLRLEMGKAARKYASQFVVSNQSLQFKEIINKTIN